MTGISLSVTIEVDRDRFGEIAEALADKTPFHEIVGDHLFNKLQDRFKEEKAPDGSPWQPLAPATVAARARARPDHPMTILRAMTDGRYRLYESFNVRAGPDDVRIGTAAVQGAIQHFGGQAGRGLKVTIPARPILGLEADDPEEIVEIAKDWLAL